MFRWGFARSFRRRDSWRWGASSVPAQDAKPQPKLVIPPDVVPSTFRAFLVTDSRFPPLKEGEGKDATEVPNPLNRSGKIHCLVCENGLAPVVAIFVRPQASAFKGG